MNFLKQLKMIDIDRVVSIKTDREFELCALELFRFQANSCTPYREYLDLMGVDIKQVVSAEQIPFMPIELFKTHDIYCAGQQPQIIFTSSSTTGITPARHLVADVTIYERDYEETFRTFYGDPAKYSLYALLPNYLQRSGSSLVYMCDGLIHKCGSGGFYLDAYERLLDDMSRDTKPKILIGVTYALLDLAEQYAPKVSDTIVMETGGMKGQRYELPKSELHKLLCEGFGVETIHSEYGMAELTSQAYSAGGGIFYSLNWLRVLIRDLNDPMCLLSMGVRGGVNIIDLGNIYSCAFIQTQDVGIAYSNNSFSIEGRVERSQIRGCNLLVQ